MKRVCCAVLAALLLCLSGCGVQSEPEQLSLLNLAQREGVGNKRRGVQQGGIDCKEK